MILLKSIEKWWTFVESSFIQPILTRSNSICQKIRKKKTTKKAGTTVHSTHGKLSLFYNENDSNGIALTRNGMDHVIRAFFPRCSPSLRGRIHQPSVFTWLKCWWKNGKRQNEQNEPFENTLFSMKIYTSIKHILININGMLFVQYRAEHQLSKNEIHIHCTMKNMIFYRWQFVFIKTRSNDTKCIQANTLVFSFVCCRCHRMDSLKRIDIFRYCQQQSLILFVFSLDYGYVTCNEQSSHREN